jgi:autotransporter-associated beta strand protein
MNPLLRAGMSCRLFAGILIFGLGAPSAFASYQTITNDAFYLTTTGTPIYTQGGGISKFGNTYYWYGVQYAGMATYYASPTAANASANTKFVAINCYSSPDMVHWTFQNKVISTSTANFTTGVGWIGRMGSVVYNSTTNQYVMWFQYSGPAGSGQACCTCSTPTGNFVLNNVQTSITNVYYDVTGDCTIFCDVDHGSTPYLVFSDSHGREHLYVSSLSSTFLAINPATLISEWPQGQEANNMFVRNGLYYACMSNLAGWSYSSAYQVNSPNIQTPSSYTADATFAGTDINDTYYSQISFVVPVAGNQTTSYILVGDRWSQNDSSYLSAGHGLGFNIMSPVTFSGTTPTFVPMASFQLDAVTGNWRAVPAFAAPTGLTATPSDGQVALSWDASGGATSYTVQRSTSSSGTYTTIASGLTTTTYTDTGLTDGTTYYYEVAAVGSTTSSYTLPVSAIPSANPAPAAPGELTATAGTTQAALSWDASTGATSYIVQRSTSSGGTYTTIASGLTGTTYTDTTVTYGPTYYYEIIAVGATNSTNSPPVSASLTGNVTWTGTTNGTWDTATTNWLFGATPALYEDGDTVVFTDTAATTAITIGNTITPAAITFSNSSTNYTVSGAGISGTGGITETGTGTLTLSNANTYTGATTLASGATLVVGNTNALQNSTLNFTNGTLNFTSTTTAATFGGLQGTNTAQNLALSNTAGAVALTVGGNNSTTTYAGKLSGTGSVTKSGMGTLTLTGANTYTGATSVSGGVLVIGAGGAINGTTASVSDTGGGIVVSGGSLTASTASGIGNGAGLTVSSGTVTYNGGLTSDSNNGANIDVTGGTLTVNGIVESREISYTSQAAVEAETGVDNGILVSGGTLNDTGNLGIGTAGGANSSSSATITAGSFTVSGKTNITLNNGGRWSILSIKGGTFTSTNTGAGVVIGGVYGGANGDLYIAGGAASINTITFGDGAQTSGSDVLNLTGGSLYVGSGGLVAGETSGTTTNVITLNGGTLGASSNWSSSLAMTLGGSTIQTANAGGTPKNITLSGALSGTGALTDTGGGTLTLSGANTYTGGATITGGTVEFATTTSMPATGTVTVGSTGTLAVMVGSGTGLFTNSTSTTTNGSIGALLAGKGGQGAAVTWSSGASLGLDTTNATGGFTYAGNITTAGLGLTKLGTGTLTLTGSNTYTSATTVNAGTLIITGNLTSSSSVSIASGATLNLTSGDNVATSGTITNGGTLVLGSGATLSSTGAFTNNGTLDLTNDPSFTLPGNFVNTGIVLTAPVPDTADTPTLPTWALIATACLLFLTAGRYLSREPVARR